MLSQAAQLEARRAWELRAVRPRHGSRGQGQHGGNHRHLQQAPPRHSPWVDAGWVANPIIEQVASAVLGPGCYLSFCDGNTALPQCGYQSLHIDSASPWPTAAAAAAAAEAFPARTTHLIVNFSPLAVDESNAAMEVWPGTHLATESDADGRCNPQTRDDAKFMLEDFDELLQRFRPPQRMAMRLGAVCFRDARCWHRGMPNATSVPRPLVALIYNAASMREDDPHLQLAARTPGQVDEDGSSALLFGADCAEAFRSSDPNSFDAGIDRNVRFAEEGEPVDHLGKMAAGLPPPSPPLPPAPRL
jgi:hypothetical protein